MSWCRLTMKVIPKDFSLTEKKHFFDILKKYISIKIKTLYQQPPFPSALISNNQKTIIESGGLKEFDTSMHANIIARI